MTWLFRNTSFPCAEGTFAYGGQLFTRTRELSGLMSKEGFHTMIAIDLLVTKVARAYSVWSRSTFSLGH